jgi:hypothetical protein
MNRAGRIFQKKVTPELKTDYGIALSDIPPHLLGQAFARAIQAAAYFPSPVFIRQEIARELHEWGWSEHVRKSWEVEFAHQASCSQCQAGHHFHN